MFITHLSPVNFLIVLADKIHEEANLDINH